MIVVFVGDDWGGLVGGGFGNEMMGGAGVCVGKDGRKGAQRG